MTRINKKGFTLIELLVVVVIITILAILLAVSYTTVQRNARDNQRRSDLQTVAGMLERFYSDNSQYPTSDTGQIKYDNSSSSCTTSPSTIASWGNDGIACNGRNYIKQLPKNPAGGSNNEYCYVASNSNQTYNLYAHLEGSGNMTSGTPSGCSGTYNNQVTSND